MYIWVNERKLWAKGDYFSVRHEKSHTYDSSLIFTIFPWVDQHVDEISDDQTTDQRQHFFWQL